MKLPGPEAYMSAEQLDQMLWMRRLGGELLYLADLSKKLKPGQAVKTCLTVCSRGSIDKSFRNCRVKLGVPNDVRLRLIKEGVRLRVYLQKGGA